VRKEGNVGVGGPIVLVALLIVGWLLMQLGRLLLWIGGRLPRLVIYALGTVMLLCFVRAFAYH
jgi:hypothetical protein